jgi:hypothetical protein
MTFNVGDQVRVSKIGVSFDENGMGIGYKWVNPWVEEQNKDVGGVFTLQAYDQEFGYQFEEGGYYYPENVLERVYH